MLSSNPALVFWEDERRSVDLTFYFEIFLMQPNEIKQIYKGKAITSLYERRKRKNTTERLQKNFDLACFGSDSNSRLFSFSLSLGFRPCCCCCVRTRFGIGLFVKKSKIWLLLGFVFMSDNRSVLLFFWKGSETKLSCWKNFEHSSCSWVFLLIFMILIS